VPITQKGVGLWVEAIVLALPGCGIFELPTKS